MTGRWDPEYLKPILRRLFDAVVEELGRDGTKARAELAARVGGTPKRLENLLQSMADFGLVRLVRGRRPSARLTTLGERWLAAEDWKARASKYGQP